MQKLISLLRSLIVLPISTSIINQNYVCYACDQVDSCINRITNMDLDHGIGKAISNAVNANIRAKAAALGENGKNYWAYQAISNPPAGNKWASSIELLKKMIASVFYQPYISSEIFSFLEQMLEHIATTIYNAQCKNIDWYSADDLRGKVFGLLNGVFVLLLLTDNIYSIESEDISFHNSVSTLLYNRSRLHKPNIYNSVYDYMQETIIGQESNNSRRLNSRKLNSRNLWQEILSKFNNDESAFKSLFEHDARCYLEQFDVLMQNKLERNTALATRMSVIDQYVQLIFLKQRWYELSPHTKLYVDHPRKSVSNQSLNNTSGTKLDYKHLSDWIKDRSQDSVYEFVSNTINTWVKKEIPDLENIINECNQSISKCDFPILNRSVKIDYDDYEFLKLINELIEFGAGINSEIYPKLRRIFIRESCELCKMWYRVDNDKYLITSTSNVKYFNPVDVLYIATSAYISCRRLFIRHLQDKNIKYDESLITKITLICNHIIYHILELSTRNNITNVNKANIIKLIDFVIQKYINDIMHDREKPSFRKYTDEQCQSVYIKRLVELLNGKKERDFEKIIAQIIDLK